MLQDASSVQLIHAGGLGFGKNIPCNANPHIIHMNDLGMFPKSLYILVPYTYVLVPAATKHSDIEER